MNGIVNGGWSYVWAAYTVTATMLVAYSVYTIGGFRKSAAKKDALNRS